ncbi:hypothetical protein V3C99_015876, partial [Haemonchus contortus]
KWLPYDCLNYQLNLLSGTTMPSAVIVVSLLICTATTGYTAMLAGGLTDQSTDDPEFMEQAWKAATKVNEEANDGDYYMIPTKVLSAKTQVVSGVMFTSKVLFEESSCKKGDVPVDQLKASNCAPKEGGKRVIYEISVLSQPWLNSEQVSVKVLRVLDPDEQV